MRIEINTIKISRHTLLILFIGFAFIIIAFGILFSSHYLIPGDRWRSLSSANMIGTLNNSIFYSEAINYAKYWSCIIFALSRFCGIPYINTNVLIFPLLYLSITSSYLFSKALLSHMSEKYSVLSSIFIATLFNTTMLIVQFSYHTFAFLLFLISLTLYFMLTKTDHLTRRNRLNTETFLILMVSSFFLIQSLMIYFIPALIGMIIIFIYNLFAPNLKNNLRIFLRFYIGLLISFLIIDFLTYNFFSWVCIRSVGEFVGVPLYFEAETYQLRRFLTSFLILPVLVIPLFFIFFTYKFSSSLSTILKQMKLKFSSILMVIYAVVLIIGFTLLCLIIFNSEPNFILNNFLLQNINIDSQKFFLFYYLTFLLGTLGISGFFGLFLSYFCFRENNKLFFFLHAWIVLIIGVASFLIFLRWIQNPFSMVSYIPSDYIYKMTYWFKRTWYYLIIPLAIFISIGLIKMIPNAKPFVNFKKISRSYFNSQFYTQIKRYASLFLVFFLIFVFSTNSIITTINWDNYTQRITDEEAQIIGWSTNNIPKDSRILHHPYSSSFRRLEKDLYQYKVYWLSAEISNARLNYEEQDEDLYKWLPSTSNYGDIKLLYEEDGRKNVILMHDKSTSGEISMVNDFLIPVINGSISFWLKIDTVDEFIDAGLHLNTYGETSEEGLEFYINFGNQYYFNNSDDVALNTAYGENEWNYYQIYFDCMQEYWNVYMNGILLNESISGESNLKFNGNPSNCSRVEILTTSLGSNYRIYLDGFNFSWEPISDEIDIYDRILNDIAKLIPHLSMNNIHYFILNIYYREEYQELIDYFYKIILYQYGNFIIYQSMEI